MISTAVVGTVLVILDGGTGIRPWIITAAFVVSLVFVGIYQGYEWRTTYAGRSTMIAMRVTALYTGHTALVAWCKYPGWEIGQALTYLAILIAVGYKLRALTHADAARDPAV